jgi:Fungal specific transcription factor domain
MDEATAGLFHRLRQLSALANSMAGSQVSPEMRTKYTECIPLLERQLNASVWSMNLNNIRQHGSATRQKESIAVRTCTRTLHCATLIFIYMVLRKTNPGSQIVEKVARRSKFSLKILTFEELWVHFPPRFLLWALVVTNVASAGHADRLWLMQTLKALRDKLALDSWEAAKAILVKFAWVDHLCTRSASLIWKELDAVEG